MYPLSRFVFSQSSLQDFADCPFRFFLRHIRRLDWPAVQAEPIRELEQKAEIGRRFHRLAQQYLLGVPEAKLARMAEASDDPRLALWWQNFLATIPPRLDGPCFIETYLAAPLGPARLAAVLDLVVVHPGGRITLYDWKTSLKRPRPDALRERMQTRVYPYLLARAGQSLNENCPVDPGQIEMIYWFAAPEMKPERIAYSRDCFDLDERDLLSMVAEAIRMNESPARPEEVYLKCPHDEGCKYCVYRSLCARGEAAGGILDDAPEPDAVESTAFQFEQIAEVPF